MLPGKGWEDELDERLRPGYAIIGLVSPHRSEFAVLRLSDSGARDTKSVFLALIACRQTEGLFANVQYLGLTANSNECFRQLVRGLSVGG